MLNIYMRFITLSIYFLILLIFGLFNYRRKPQVLQGLLVCSILTSSASINSVLEMSRSQWELLYCKIILLIL